MTVPTVALLLVGSLALLPALAWTARLLARDETVSSAERNAAELRSDGYGVAHDAAREKPTGLYRWLVTVDHTDIGVMYLLFGIFAFFWGGTDAMMMRVELLTPTAEVFDVHTYNALFTAHGVTMLFLFVTPVFFGLTNYFLPILLGADDMAFPRLNALGFWLLPGALLLVRADIFAAMIGTVLAGISQPLGQPFLDVGHAATGWTLYTPLSVLSETPHIDLMLLGLHLSGVSTTIGAINVIVTVFTERTDAVTWNRLDILSWALLVQAAIVVFAFPLLGSALLMLLADRNFGTVFFAPEGGGPVLWQHLFWFFGHPEVYILVLPAFGLVSYILPKFAGRKLFGYRFIVYSTLAIGVLSFGVWSHHMFATGLNPRLEGAFMAVTISIAVPSAVKVFNWITTIWNGRVRLTAPMLFCVGGIAVFVVGGVTGVFLAAVPVDLLLHETHYVVGHFHFIVVGIIPMAMFAAGYYWFPILTGRMFDRRLARVHFWLTVVGVTVTFLSLLALGYMGHPRRYATYPARFQQLHVVATTGASMIAVGQGVWAWNVIQSWRRGPRVRDADVWNLREVGAFTREWEWFEQRLAARRAEQSAESPPTGEASEDASERR